MERVTFGSLMSNIVVIGLDGEIRTLEQGQLPKPGELIINEVSDTSELVIEQVTPQGSSINVTGDITALIEAIAAGQDPTQLGQEFETAAGEANGSSPQTTGSVARTGTELLASTNFETVGTEGAGFSTTQILTLLDIIPPTQAPAPTGIPIPVTITVQDISSPTVDEGQQVSFDVTLNQPAEEETTIEFTLNDGSAVGGAASDVGADYVNTTVLITLSDGTTQEIQVNDDGSFTVSLPIGEESFTVSLDTIDDNLAEGSETFSLSGSTPDQPTPVTGVATITDEAEQGPEDTVTVTMIGPNSVSEGETTSEYTVTLSDPAPVGSIVTLAYSYTTASGDDITETTQAIIGADGVTATFTIDTVDDVYAEGDEVFRVSVSGIVDSDSNPIFEALDVSNAFVDTTISDETDPGPEDTVTVTMTGPANVVEGDTTTEYTVTLSDPAPVGSIVTLAYSYTTASGDDITETTQAIIGADGVNATFTIDTVDDVYAEGDEVFRVSVSGIVDSDSNPIFEALNLDNAFVDTTISDETGPGPEDTVTVTMTGPANVVEGDTTTDYTVTLSDPAPVGSIVTLAYSYTTASGDDITETTQAVIGADGVTATFTIDTVDDVYAEGDEVFRVSVSGIVDSDSNPIFEALDVSNAFVDTTIRDEMDPGPEDTVTMTGPANVVEGDTTTDYTVTLSDPAPVGSIVTLAYSYTTASGDDITETTQAIIGADGVTATFTIDTVDDVYAEGDEVFRVSVSGIVDSDSNPIFEALNLDNAFVDTTISDETDPGPEDTVTVTMTGPANVVEGDTTTDYIVTLSDPAPVGSIVTLAYSYTTASGDDITETTQAIIGADGVTATFTIDTVDDVYAEGDEVFRVSVSGIVDSDSNPIFEALDVSNAFVDTTIRDEMDPGPEDTVTVTMTGPANVVEGDTTTEYTVTLSDPAPVGSIVTLAYSYTTASGDDITETTQAIIGADGVTATFTIDTVDDVYAEGDEVFRVSVSGIVDSDSNPIFEALNLDNAFVDTTISDETDPGPEDTVTVTMTGPANVVEGDTTTDYTVTLSDPAPVGSIVTLAYSYTTASGDDITETTQAIIGADGVTATFTIDTVDDVYAESDEVFRVSVSGIVDSDSNPIFEALNLDNAFVDTTISDETDPGPEDTVTVTMTGPANVVEGDTTTDYTVTLSDPAPVGSIVTLAYSYTTASGDDITETTQAVIGADGVTATFTIDTVDDVYAEGDEVFRVSVSGIVDSDSNPIFEALNLDNAFVDTTISDETDPGPKDTVTVTMTGPANVVEGDTTTDYTVTLSDPAPVGSIVTLAYSYTTASGDDITETTQAVIGADGVTATFTIDTVDDVYAEGDEVFRVSVSGIVDSDSNPIFEALNLDNAFVDTTISDETDPGPEDTVTVTMTGPANVVEGDTTEYTVTLSDPAPVGSIVTLAYSYTTASGDDITETTQAVIGADGVTATFTIDTVDDVYAEGDEVFRVSVSGIVDSDSNPIFEALDVSNAFVDTTISDETDPGPEDTVTVTMTGPANVVEGDTTTEYTVTLSDPAPVGSIVTLAYSYTTASGDDITETTQAIIGADGVTATFTIDTVDDVYAEGDEVFRVSVSGIVDSDSNPIFEALNLDNAFVDTTISDETDPGPEDTVTVTMTGPANVVEGDTTTDYTVTLSDPAPVGSIVTLAYSYTTASGDDITETTQAVIGADGVTATFTIDTVDDVYVEGDEVFRVSVSGIVDSDSNPIFEALDVSNAFVDTTISDETDPGPEDTVTVTMTGPANVVEGDTTTDYTVTLSDPAPVGSIVTLAYSYTTASGDDITETTQAIIGADGVTATFTIDTVDDVYAEGDEVFRVSVSGIVDSDSNPIFEALDVSNAFVDTTISDETDPGPEDTVTVTMTGPANVVEGDTTTDYTVTLSDPAPVGSIVTLAYSYTTASGADITETTQAIIGADGVTATFTIDTVDDVYAEGDEVFRVSVSGIVDSDSNPIFEALDVTNAFVDTTISDETDPGPEDTVTVTMTGPANVVEGDTTTDYTVTLSDPAPVGSIVTLAYSYTTASGDDITETTQAVIGADGVTATFTIDTVDDVYAEGDEVFRVSVSGIVDSDSNPIFEALNLDNAFVDTTISDETDPGPEDTVTVTMTGPANVVEGDTTTEYTVTLSDPAPVGSIVTLAYSYTTASGDDITETTQAIIGADGITATFTIDTVDDVYAEGDEVFRVSVSGIVDGDSNPIFEALDVSNAFVDTTISDETDPGPEDTVTVTMTGPANVVEGDTTTDYTVTLSDPAPVGSIVTLAYSYTTASGDDITETTQAIIGADGLSATFTIDTVDDSDDEPDEVYRVSVASIVDGDDNPIFEALDLTNAYVDTTIIDNDEPNTPPIARDFIISLNVQEGIFPVQDVEFDGLTSTNEQRVEDIEDDAVAANDGDILIQVVDLPEHGELYYVDGNGQEVIIDETTQFPENTEVKYRLTDDFFEEQSFDSADLLEDQGKDILVDSYTPPNSNLTFTGGQIITVGNSIIFDSDAQISVDFANQQVGLVVVSPNETGQGDEISTGEYITLELDEDLSANEAKLNLASLNDRFNNGGAWLTAYIFLNGALVDVQQFYSTDINYTSNHEGSITVSLANGSFDEIRLTPETDSSSNKASFTLVGTEITSFTDVNDDFTYQAIDTDGAISNEATVAVEFENVTVDAVTALGYQTMALNSELNLIMGTDGDDILVGTDGNDMIIGGLGNDILTGGEGDDVFKWTEMQSATDTVTDFSDGDQLDFTDVFDDMTGTDISTLLDDLGSGDYRGRVDDITVEVTESGGNSTLTINKDGQQLEVNFDGASAADIANSLISNLEQLRE
ncbi:Calx-beta domain-containing protein [Vibrio parahaemolyticus]|uniref:Calx-beta domain-containing protein n=10 Tax=Vibrio parahaemolyticus TaxID=670 RepID=UPI001EEB9678|nr:Calx-beta domain-containing protein [Vibrio parahaemolyticus]MCG6478422.1 calcium-binding protein [Vibrio parahaemolyticus]